MPKSIKQRRRNKAIKANQRAANKNEGYIECLKKLGKNPDKMSKTELHIWKATFQSRGVTNVAEFDRHNEKVRDGFIKFLSVHPIFHGKSLQEQELILEEKQEEGKTTKTPEAQAQFFKRKKFSKWLANMVTH